MQATGTTEIRHIATGGGTRNELLMRHKAALAPWPIEVAEITEATALGASDPGPPRSPQALIAPLD